MRFQAWAVLGRIDRQRDESGGAGTAKPPEPFAPLNESMVVYDV